MTQLHVEGVKRWGKEFEAPRPSKTRDNGGKIVDLITNENLGEEKDIVQFVFNDYIDIQDPEAPGEFDEVIEFCNKEPFDPTRLAAWIDDRGNDELQGLGKLRVPARLQTLLGLNRILREQPFDTPDYLATRRLVYICDLDPYAINTLLIKAGQHTLALRDTIDRHLTLRPTLRVKTTSTSYISSLSNFAFIFCLPFFILRESPTQEPAGPKIGPRRRKFPLSFLNMKPRNTKEKMTWYLHETQFSCVVTGSGDWNWAAYGFGDSEYCGTMEDIEEEYVELDQLVLGKLFTNPPIWKPREYFLRLLEIWMERAARETRIVVAKLGSCITEYIAQHPFTITQMHTIDNSPEMIKSSFNWTLATMQVIQTLHHKYTEALRACDVFSDDHGDVGFFLDSDASKSEEQEILRTIFTRIKAEMQELQLANERLGTLRIRCVEYSNFLQLRLSMEAKTAGDRNEGFQKLAMVLTPFALASSLFSVNPQALPFETTSHNFISALFLMLLLVPLLLVLLPIASSILDSANKRAAAWLMRSPKKGTPASVGDSSIPGDLDSVVVVNPVIEDEERGFSLPFNGGELPGRSLGTRSLTGTSILDGLTLASASF